MRIDRQQLEDLMDQFDTLAYQADTSKSFNIGKFKIYENAGFWIVSDSKIIREFSTRMAALSWAKFTAEGRNDMADTVDVLSEQLDGATTQLKQLIKASRNSPAVLGKIDPAADKRKERVEDLANFILKNS